jgi:hypothetical protein
MVVGFKHTVFSSSMFFEDKSSIPVELCCGLCAQPWPPATAVACPKCEEIFCRACIEDHLVKSTTCPKCNQNVDPADMRPPHRQLKSVAAHTPVLCPNRPGGCWKGPWGELETHLSACPFDHSKIVFVDKVPADLHCEVCFNPLRAPEACPLCQQLFCGACLRQSLQRESKCPNCRGDLVEDLVQQAPRQVTSMLAKMRVSCFTKCGWIGPRNEYDAHLPACPLRTAAHSSAAVAMSPVAGPNIPVARLTTVSAVSDAEPVAAPIANGLVVANDSKAYHSLAMCLTADESVTLPDGRVMDNASCTSRPFATMGLTPRRTATWRCVCQPVNPSHFRMVVQ